MVCFSFIMNRLFINAYDVIECDKTECIRRGNLHRAACVSSHLLIGPNTALAWYK